MKTRLSIACVIMIFVLALTANAEGKGEIQKYFNDAVTKVKAAKNVSEKRAILNGSFQTMSKALDMVQRSSALSNNDRAGIDRIKASIQEKQNELDGSNGYVRVADTQLNLFADYVVQDMEQADQMISISVVTLLLIIIIIVLLV